jgi:hypothetical protein
VTGHSLDLILVKASGTALITLALFRLPDVFRAIAQLFMVMISRIFDDSSGEIDAMISKMNQSFISSAVGDLLAFAVLLLLARWMFGFPKFMRSAFRRSGEAVKSQDAADVADGEAV